MLLFSTMLDMNDTMKDVDFVRLLIYANKDHDTYDENIIPEEEILWNQTDTDCDFGDDNLSLKTRKYGEGHIMAARFEKKETNGMFWRTDYVWNMEDKRMSIRLSRVYQKGATSTDRQFYPPSFIKYLIQGGYLEDDADLSVSDSYITIGEDNIQLLTNAVNGTVNYRFPIVYVSKRFSDNEYPLDVEELAKRLRGVAHVFAEADNSLALKIASESEDKHTFDGAVTVYYPNKAFDKQTINRRHGYENKQDEFINKTLGLVLDYMNCQELPALYTWGSVTRRIALDSAIEANELVDSTDEEITEKDNLIEACSEKIEEKDKKIEELYWQVNSLEYENKRLKDKVENAGTAISLNLGEEKEYLVDEAQEIILDALEEKMKDYDGKRKRRHTILKSVVEGNVSPGNLKKCQEEVKNIMKGYRKPSAPIDKKLGKLGITFYKYGDHPGYIYHHDERFLATLTSSGGDYRGGDNLAEEINNTMF